MLPRTLVVWYDPLIAKRVTPNPTAKTLCDQLLYKPKGQTYKTHSISGPSVPFQPKQVPPFPSGHNVSHKVKGLLFRL